MDTKSAARTLDLFEVFSTVRRPMTLTELAKALDSPISSCFQLIKTLERRGYAFSLGPRRGIYPTKRMLLAMNAIATHDPLQQIFAQSLSDLRYRTQETAVLSQLIDNRAGLLDSHESPQLVRYAPQIGEFYNLHSTAVGKALLSVMGEKERDKVLSGRSLQKLTGNTLVDRADIEEELKRSRERGWFMSRGENLPDLCAAAVSVQINGQHFAIGLGGPYHRFLAEIERHAEALMDVAVRLNVGD